MVFVYSGRWSFALGPVCLYFSLWRGSFWFCRQSFSLGWVASILGFVVSVCSGFCRQSFSLGRVASIQGLWSRSVLVLLSELSLGRVTSIWGSSPRFVLVLLLELFSWLGCLCWGSCSRFVVACRRSFLLVRLPLFGDRVLGLFWFCRQSFCLFRVTSVWGSWSRFVLVLSSELLSLSGYLYLRSVVLVCSGLVVGAFLWVGFPSDGLVVVLSRGGVFSGLGLLLLACGWTLLGRPAGYSYFCGF